MSFRFIVMMLLLRLLGFLLMVFFLLLLLVEISRRFVHWPGRFHFLRLSVRGDFRFNGSFCGSKFFLLLPFALFPLPTTLVP